MVARPDVRLDDAPMEPMTCRLCKARVQVRKSSWDATSIQWDQEASDACLERRQARPDSGPNGATFPGCSELALSVREAAVRGDVHVASQEPVPTNPLAHDPIARSEVRH